MAHIFYGRLTGLSITLALTGLGLASPAQAKNLPLKAGTYQCSTTTMMQGQAPAPTDQADARRRAAGNTIQPMAAPQIMLAPAAFGNVILDGKGGYRMPAVRQAGKYGFNASTGRPTFTGDLGVMLRPEYSGTGTSFFLGLEGMNFQCALTGASAGTSGGGGSGGGISTPIPPVDPQAALAASVGPVLKTASAADFKGHFSGSYFCGQGETSMVLDLAAKPDGSITAVMQFGANSSRTTNYIVGSYSLKGTYKGSHFILRSQQWIKQPDGYAMVDMEGDLTALGASGKMLFDQCGVFAVERVRP
jgi:hypothetical protein